MSLLNSRVLASGEAEATRLREFAKEHVRRALKEASERATIQYTKYDKEPYILKESILKAYSLENIK